MANYVVTYDNGSGFHEWASTAQDSQEAALAAAKIDASQLGCARWGYTLCRVENDQATPCDFAVAPDLSQWEGDYQFDQGGNYIG